MTTWKSRRGMGLLAGLCILGGPACQTVVAPESHEATAVVERLRAHRLEVKEEGARPRAVLPPSGGRQVERVEGGLTVKPEKPLRGDSRHPAHVVLPEVAQRPFQVKDLHSGLTLEVALEGARPAKAEVVDGYVVYPDAHPEGADVVHRFTPEGTEDYLSFERAPSVPEVRYGLTLGAGARGLRLVGDTLEVLDGSGAPRLRMAPPYVVGADGRVTPAHVSVEGCAVDTRASAPWERPVTEPGSRQCQVRVGWSAEAVKYPAVLDPMWSTTGSLAVARLAHASTDLPDGRVLVVGGFNLSGALSSAELYDPATGTWATMGSLATGRLLHSAQRLGSGLVLVAGGSLTWSPYQPLSTAELYDPATGTWSSAGSMTTARHHHQSILLGDGRVLVIGGRQTSSSSVSSTELYDPASNTWAPTGSLLTPRYHHMAALLSTGKVLVAGGESNAAANSCELYDPSTGTWMAGGTMSTWQFRPLGIRLDSGQVLMLATDIRAAELYDPATNTWSRPGSPLLSRHFPTLSRLQDGRVLMVGGLSANGMDDTTLSELYDPATGTWSSGTFMRTGRSRHSTRVLQDGRVLTVGGQWSVDEYTPLASAELLLLDVDDVTAPTVTLTSPSEGAVFKGTVTLAANASDDYAVNRVEFFDGNTLIATDALSPYSVDWNTRSAANGSHVLTARVYDGANNVGTSAPISVSLDNDLTPPAVTFTSPAAGSTPPGVLTVSADVSDDRGVVSRVEFWNGRTQLGVDTEAPYSLSWDATQVPGGPHTLVAKAYDPTGNEGKGSVSLIVSQPGTASFDSTLKVPRCGTPGPLCDSGSYLTGRSSQDPELNSPNTLQGSCADSTLAGSIGYDIALERIRVSTTDGGPMVGGKQVRLEVTVRATPDYNGQALELFAASDATQPAWSYLTTLYPLASGTQTLTTSYVLSGGTLQAVRGRFRQNGAWASCGSAGTYVDHDDLAFAVERETVAPTVSLTAPSAGATVRGTVTLSASASDNAGVTKVEFYLGANLMGSDTTAPYSLSWNTTSVANGGYTLVAKAYDEAGNVGQSASLSVTVSNDKTAPTVSLIAPSVGATLSATTTFSASASDNVGVSRVYFWVGTTLVGSDTTAPYSLSWNTTSVANGSYMLLATAWDAASNIGQSAQVQVTVSNPVAPPAPGVSYDTVLGAPRCGSAGSSCDSGSLLNGRANLGPEANAPNTVDTCTDGTDGTYHGDESLDGLKVSTLDGSAIAVGKTVRIDAKVWGYSGYSSDFLDLYYAPDASAPNWTYLGTMNATAAGTHVLSKTYTLPSGSARAVVRGVFRYSGSSGSCPGGSYTDVDDLVFPVQ